MFHFSYGKIDQLLERLADEQPGVPRDHEWQSPNWNREPDPIQGLALDQGWNDCLYRRLVEGR